ncbi:MAG: glutamine synthetase [Alphaproteobacteria bacterium]|nr:glutamine synthetase [Alphaproteobacteria bacterium]
MNKAATIPTFARPAFALEARAEFEALAAEHPDIQSVDAVVVDLCGTLRGKRLPIHEAYKIFESGLQLPHSIYLMDARGEMTNPFDRGFGDGDPDGTAWPLPQTARLVWGGGAPRAQVFLSLRDGSGEPDPAEPISALERVLDRFRDAKLTPVCALELEFYLVDSARLADGAPQPPLDPRTGAREKTASVYGVDDLDRFDGFLSALAQAAAAEDVPVSATSKEYAPGQFEANLKHQSKARHAADHAVLLQQIVKAAARQNGFGATFMAKPYADRAGSGLHIHLSLLDRSGRNVFDNGSAEGSVQLRHAIGGLQAAMAESMALFAPSVNSYRRFQPDMFAPVNRRWGVNNRSAGIRVPAGPSEARRIEHRVAGADANPYLALAAVLAGVLHGLENKIDPGPPANGNVSRDPDMSLPFTIDDALARLEQAAILPAYLSGETLALYRETKRIEAQRVRRVIPPVEHEWYL